MFVAVVERSELVAALRLTPGRSPGLRDAAAGHCFGWERLAAERATQENLQRLHELQNKLYADRRYAVLIVLQAFDGGGKDSTIRRVFGAFNPQGCNVVAFKPPSLEEQAHDFLWRVHQHAPAKGSVAIFNRSHYEDVLVPVVERSIDERVARQRYAAINDFERLLTDNATRVVKIFLQISRAEQKRRFEERRTHPEKRWKLDLADLAKRRQWSAYHRAYSAAFSACGTAAAPWYVVPADRRWFRDLAVSQIVRAQFEQLRLRWPVLDPRLARAVLR
ncbi:MAG: polyphosphate kinase 2 family protein [Gammaproteobacteria bacterium]|nr:polyphosphate kinase 2 family protein [Gammaproteobacteria bacterium]